MADLVMPKLGLTMTEGLLREWRIAAGEAFKAGDVVFTVETDKVANEIEADADGVLAEVLVPEGETVPVGTPVARLAGGAVSRPMSAAPRAAPPPAPGGRIVATPLARRLAAAAGIDLAALVGSGANGRIKAADVEAASADARPAAPEAVPTAPQATATLPGAVREIDPGPARLATARRVAAARRDIPDFSVSHTADVADLMALRETLNAADGRPRVSVTHMLIRALGIALAEMPGMNRVWAGETILAYATADVGMVTETPDGLRIPIVRDAGGLSLDAIAAAAAGLAARARAGALSAQDVGGGVVAVSNVGMFGVTAMTPIINPPHAMILGVGADRPVFRPDADGRPALRRELALTLVCDHRVIDGAEAARFLAAVVRILETPVNLLRPPRLAA
ncbi:dihydrolipoamide acyltransferase [Acuticoccus sediminis]|uniref:Dihydrolipoamide acetyltransferase component of pyruvate dehydrogenase complex n=1 Tax=Acuticoccus sediminis TaxID=2184697 RepID=A0A8B2NJA7_9HYPH|nr:2-oxo acid dehydrogenase subunit E2 [Acuticoccus sediminis]RAH98366.1 dihydrolipoamide acyltransferase [Acuticoccus sediminis]